MDNRRYLILKSVPETIAYLILLHLHNSLDEAEGEELDEWITASDENLEIFEELIDVQGRIYK
jgi:hypothetical protein